MPRNRVLWIGGNALLIIAVWVMLVVGVLGAGQALRAAVQFFARVLG